MRTGSETDPEELAGFEDLFDENLEEEDSEGDLSGQELESHRMKLETQALNVLAADKKVQRNDISAW